ncbi:ABC transporter substrate-binding protein [Microbacterium saperdae]|uniref:Peptide/nickel transport system substrate-binding protein n=1 Tax=Microbacterium saperdae TaxID=69368 RepID=A0A543BLC4_9MICO|nr:ABC transporter substrate-binding protein [Microbacterium saperdae]TQL85604.1 peptide/nickel transport system substrate-binding protein [Microbacterium saperdae]GGM62346.1 ABC transporter substrate-binding protein [Microbacterium saperdae]
MNGTRKRTVVAALGIILSASLFAGCATGATEQDGDAEQTLVIGSQMATISNLDTTRATSGGYENQRLIAHMMYEGLTKRDVSDPDVPAGVAPALAESWTVADDGLTYTFFLREQVTFHDGTPWDADAAVYNFDRYLNEDNPNYDPALLSWFDPGAYIESVEKVDDMTIALHLHTPYAYLLEDLYSVYFGSPAVLEKSGGKGMAENPTGTGPFKFEEQSSPTEISFVKNDDWWGEGPKLDRIIVKLIPDPSARTAALRSGTVDWIEGAQPDDLASLKDAGFTVTSKEFDWEWSWQLFVDRPPFDDVRVREALNFAIDRETIATTLLAGTAVPAQQILSSASRFYDSANDTYEYDPEKARKLLDDAGYADGLDITVGYVSAGSGAMQPKAMNEAIQAQLAEVGINVTLQPLDFGAFYGALAGKDVDWNAANGALNLERPGTWGWLFLCGQSWYGYCNPEVDTLLQQAASTPDDDARTAKVTEATALLTEDAAWLSVVGDTAPRAMASSVKGFEQPMSWALDFAGVYIEE